MKEGISKTYLPTMVATCKEWEHKGLVVEANLCTEATQEDGHHEVVGAMDHQEVNTNTGVEYAVKGHQEETTSIGALTEATMVMGTKTTKTLVTEMDPAEEATEMVTEAR